MIHLINKSALVAEIESLKSAAETMLTGKTDLSYWKAQKHLCERILSFIGTLEVKDVPIWEKVSPDTGQTTLYKDEDKSYLERFGYRIDLKELDKLPKKNLKA